MYSTFSVAYDTQLVLEIAKFFDWISLKKLLVFIS